MTPGIRRSVRWTLATTLAAALLFTAFPEIDLRVAGLFHAPDGFALETPLWARMLRGAAWDFALALAVIAALMLILALVRPSLALARRVWGFVLLAYLLGPGLLVNGLLKSYWGRARPRSVTEFGGAADFTPALLPADECARNCSFVSGEASAAVTTALVLTLLVLPALPSRFRRPTGALIWLSAVLVGLIRVGAGGHFLSDAVFAGLFSALVTLALFAALRVGDAAEGAALRDLGRLRPRRDSETH